VEGKPKKGGKKRGGKGVCRSRKCKRGKKGRTPDMPAAEKEKGREENEGKGKERVKIDPPNEGGTRKKGGGSYPERYVRKKKEEPFADASGKRKKGRRILRDQLSSKGKRKREEKKKGRLDWRAKEGGGGGGKKKIGIDGMRSWGKGRWEKGMTGGGKNGRAWARMPGMEGKRKKRATPGYA